MEFFNKEKFIQDAMANGITRKAAIKVAESYVITECQYESDSDSDSESDGGWDRENYQPFMQKKLFDWTDEFEIGRAHV